MARDTFVARGQHANLLLRVHARLSARRVPTRIDRGPHHNTGSAQALQRFTEGIRGITPRTRGKTIRPGLAEAVRADVAGDLISRTAVDAIRLSGGVTGKAREGLPMSIGRLNTIRLKYRRGEDSPMAKPAFIYAFDNLGLERFAELCGLLLATRHKGFLLGGVGADGGIDTELDEVLGEWQPESVSPLLDEVIQPGRLIVFQFKHKVTARVGQVRARE